MMTFPRMAALALPMILAAACASQPSGPPPLDPVGTFDFTTAVEGSEVTGSIEISKASTGTGYTGWLTSSVGEPIQISSVTVEGQRMTVLGNAPEGQLTLVATFTGNDFVADWSYAGLAGSATGRRRTT